MEDKSAPQEGPREGAASPGAGPNSPLQAANKSKFYDAPPLDGRNLLPPSERAPSAPVPSIVYENWTGVDIMFHLDGRRRLQSLVYFGNS